jgi:hypothetical protein
MMRKFLLYASAFLYIVCAVTVYASTSSASSSGTYQSSQSSKESKESVAIASSSSASTDGGLLHVLGEPSGPSLLNALTKASNSSAKKNKKANARVFTIYPQRFTFKENFYAKNMADRPLLSISDDQSLTLYNVVDEKVIRQSIPSIKSPACNPDGKSICVLSKDAGKDVVTLYNTENGQVIGESISGYKSLYSPNSKSICVLSKDAGKDVVTLYSTENGQVIGQPILGHGSVYSPNGKSICVLSKDAGKDVVTLYNTENGQVIRESISGHKSLYSPNGKSICVRSRDAGKDVVTLYSTANGQVIGQPILGHGSVYSHDGKSICVRSRDADKDVVTLYSTANGQVIGQPILGYILEYSPDSKSICVRSRDADKEIGTLCNTANGQVIGKPILGCIPEYSPDSKSICVRSRDADKDVVTLYSTANGQVIGKPILGYFSGYRHDSKSICIVSRDSQGKPIVTLCNTANGQVIGKPMLGYFSGYSHDGQRIRMQSPDADRKVWVYNTEDMKLIGKYYEISEDLRYGFYINNSNEIIICALENDLIVKIAPLLSESQAKAIDSRSVKILVLGIVLVLRDKNWWIYDLYSIIISPEVQALLPDILPFDRCLIKIITEYMIGLQPLELTSEQQAAQEQKVKYDESARKMQELMNKDKAQQETADQDAQNVFRLIKPSDTDDAAEEMSKYLTRYSKLKYNDANEGMLIYAVRCGAKKCIKKLLEWQNEYVATEYHRGIARIDLDYLNQGLEAVCLAIEQQKFKIACLIASRMTYDQLQKRNKNGKTVLQLLEDNRPAQEDSDYNWLKILCEPQDVKTKLMKDCIQSKIVSEYALL